jgi:hypothetical protein
VVDSDELFWPSLSESAGLCKHDFATVLRGPRAKKIVFYFHWPFPVVGLSLRWKLGFLLCIGASYFTPRFVFQIPRLGCVAAECCSASSALHAKCEVLIMIFQSGRTALESSRNQVVFTQERVGEVLDWRKLKNYLVF